jgi:hypothetical protein
MSAGLEPFHRVAKDVAHADVRSWTTRLAASEAFVHRVVQAGIAHARLHQWHVFVTVVRMIEPGSRAVFGYITLTFTMLCLLFG